VVNPNEKFTLSQSKSFCDSLKDKCEGFMLIIPTKGTVLGSNTIFISKVNEGWEDPDTYYKITDNDTINTNIISYIKKEVNAVEKAVPQDKLNVVSDKYKNLVTCNWKSSNRCIFKDYTYNQLSDSCVAKDGNPAYSVDGLKSYSQPTFTSWLDTLYKRDSGVNKLASEAVNVNEYVQRCKEVDGYEFLGNIPLPNPYIPTTKPGDVKGRYVRITINNANDNWLNFAELQAISNNRNIAVGKPASASSTYYGTPPSRGNDGNSLGEWNNGSVAHNDNTGGPEYWEVDLGDASQTIDRIIISNRTDCCQGRLNNWLLSIYDYNKNLIWARIYREAPNPTVSIDILNANNDMNNIRVKDYNQSRFNNYFTRVSDTEYNSKRGWDGKGCYDTCHKEICEGEKKKWIGNSNWYGCRDYKPGELEAELAEKRRLEQQNNFIPIPNNTQHMVAYRGQMRKIFSINITGTTNGNAVWGTDNYTDDSDIRRAAVHAGIIVNGENKTVYIEMLPGQSSYISTNKNSINTFPYGNWGGTYRFVKPNNASLDGFWKNPSGWVIYITGTANGNSGNLYFATSATGSAYSFNTSDRKKWHSSGFAIPLILLDDNRLMPQGDTVGRERNVWAPTYTDEQVTYVRQ
jgi:hypothetical protein